MEDRFRVRGWDVIDCGYYDDIQNMLVDGSEFGLNGDVTLLDAISRGLIEMIPEQCTGLKDKNGKLIYEGDIVKYDNELYKPQVVNWEYNPYTSSVGLCSVDKNTEIIGNIHENPELLEGK